jgi:hypothetical protein
MDGQQNEGRQQSERGETYICLIIEFSFNLFGDQDNPVLVYLKISSPCQLRTTESLPECHASRVTTRLCKSC